MENFTIIGCRSYKTYGDLDFCRMASPNNKSYFIQAGATTDRITTLTLDLKNRICSIEVRRGTQNVRTTFRKIVEFVRFAFYKLLFN